MATATGWYLENRTPGHSKFYLVLIIDNVAVTNWGRIGADGQAKIQAFSTYDEAKDIALRQYYSKKARQYHALYEDVVFEVEDAVLNEACEHSAHQPLTRLFFTAAKSRTYAGESKAVAEHYRDFVSKAQALMDRASGDFNFEEVFAEFEQLEKAWGEISERHDEAAVTLSVTKSMLAQRLMSGSAT